MKKHIHVCKYEFNIIIFNNIMIIGYDLRYSIEALSTRPVLSVIFPSVYTNPILNVPDQRVRLLKFSRCIEELLLGG